MASVGRLLVILLEPRPISVVDHVPELLSETPDSFVASNAVGPGDPLKLPPGQRVEQHLSVHSHVQLPLTPILHQCLL